MAVTRADVAQRAGVSPAVVSYVLNPGMRPVAAQTRERVLAAVAELGYRPNAVAQALRSGPTRSLGLLVPDLTNPFFAEVARAVEQAAFERERVLLVGSAQDDPAREAAYIRSFVDRRVDALLLVAPRSLALLEEVASSGLPVVTLDRVDELSAMTSVRVDNANGVTQAVARLVELGHQRIGMIGGPAGLRVADDRVEGWREGLSQAGLKPRRTDLVRAPFTRAGGTSAGARLLRDASLTAVVTSADVQAVGLLSQARVRGVLVPEDVSVFSFDGTELAPFADPPLSVIQQPIEELAATAMSAVEQMLAGELAPTRSILTTRLVERGSTTSVPKRS